MRKPIGVDGTGDWNGQAVPASWSGTKVAQIGEVIGETVASETDTTVVGSSGLDDTIATCTGRTTADSSGVDDVTGRMTAGTWIVVKGMGEEKEEEAAEAESLTAARIRGIANSRRARRCC